jgi:hypothetical protein
MNWTNLDFTPLTSEPLKRAKFLVANGANPRARNSDTKVTPSKVAFCEEETKLFLGLAERHHKRLQERSFGIFKKLSVQDKKEVQSLERELESLRLGDQEIQDIKNDVYLESQHRVVLKKLVLTLVAVFPARKDWVDVLEIVAEFAISPNYYDCRVELSLFDKCLRMQNSWQAEDLLEDASSENGLIEDAEEEEKAPCAKKQKLLAD